jgi:hypothetical protein
MNSIRPCADRYLYQWDQQHQACDEVGWNACPADGFGGWRQEQTIFGGGKGAGKGSSIHQIPVLRHTLVFGEGAARSELPYIAGRSPEQRPPPANPSMEVSADRADAFAEPLLARLIGDVKRPLPRA